VINSWTGRRAGLAAVERAATVRELRRRAGARAQWLLDARRPDRRRRRPRAERPGPRRRPGSPLR